MKNFIYTEKQLTDGLEFDCITLLRNSSNFCEERNFG